MSQQDLTLIHLFREEASAHVELFAELVDAADGLDTTVLMRLAEQSAYVRGAAVCAELSALVRVLDWVEQSIQRRQFVAAPARLAVEWLRHVMALPAESVMAWNEMHDEISRQWVERWEAGEGLGAVEASDVSGQSQADDMNAAPAIDPAMMELFRSEVESHTFAMSDGLIAVDADPTATERLEGIMRAAHSIKGAARILTIDPAVSLAHVAEERVQGVIRSGGQLTPEDIEALLNACDLFSTLAKVTSPREWSFAEQARFLAATAAIESHSAPETSAPMVDGRSPVAAARARLSEHLAGEAKQDSGTPAAKNPEEAPQSASHRTVKVSAVHLERLLGLAGESVMNARDFAPFARTLHQVALHQTAVLDQLAELRILLGDQADEGPLAYSLARVRESAEHVRREIALRHTEADEYARRTDELSRRIYRETIGSRMRPFKDGVQWFPRLVFDVARKLGKAVDFRIVGESVKVDRDILEKLEAPLNHLLRNALDHGLEEADERRQAGKSERASLVLEAKHWAGMLSVTVTDDGRGIDVERVRQKIIDRSFATEEEALQLLEPQVLEYLFAPGFSTRDNVSEISGRGVGLDVVKTAVHEVGGSVRVHSQPGKGTQFQLMLPLTLSVIRAVIVRIAGEDYALPLVRVHRLVRTEAENLIFVEGRPCLDVEGERLGLISACEVLGLPLTEPSSMISVVVLRNYLGSFGIVVDAVVGEQDLVVRTLDPRLGRVSDILAAAILPDGRPALILAAEDLMRSVAHLLDKRQLAARHELRENERRHILVVDDSVTVREVERQLLLANGYEVTVAVDGADAWQMVRVKSFDLVVSDVDMPRMDGLELTRSIRRDVRLRGLPIIIVSYRDKPEDRIRAEEAGASRYLPKSAFHEEALLELVRELIGSSS